MKLRSKGLSAAVASAVFLGLTPIFGKQAMNLGFSPLAVVAIRSTIAMLLLAIFLLVFKRNFFYIYPLGLVGCLVAGFINGVGSSFYYIALSRLDASVGQLLYSFYPLLVAFWLLLDMQSVSKMTIFRLLLVIPGVYFLVSSGRQEIDMLGAGLMLSAALLYALHMIINQRILYEAPAPTVTFYTLLSMSLTVVTAFLLFKPGFPEGEPVWWPIFALALITFLSRLTLFMGVKHLGGMQTALMGLGELLITVVLAQVFLHEQLQPGQWLGAVLIVLSLILVTFEKPSSIKKKGKGFLYWLNTPSISPTDSPFQG